MGQKERLYADIMAMNPEVTGSCNLVVVKLPNDKIIRFVADCGMFQERKYEELNDSLPFNPENIDFCLITHNHVDHTGRLPLMVKKGFYKKIYTTTTTAKLIPLALKDSQKVLASVAKRKNRKPIYHEADVANTIELLEPCEYNESIQIDEHIKVTFLKNGHLIGAALILVQIGYPEYEDINILFTGDYNNKNMFFDVSSLPDWVLELPLTIVQEATYGDMYSNQITKCFEKNVLSCINKGGTVLSPVFSLGRTQEILYVLKLMQDSGKLDKEIPIFLDGKLAIKYTELYIKDGLDIKENMREFLPENLIYVTKENRCEVLEDTNKKIVLTTSGMGSYGPAQVYIPEYISRRNVLIQFTGYTAEGTLGARLKNTKIEESVEVGGLVVKKYSQVEYTTEFSAHAKADEMIEFLKQFRQLKLVLVNHAEIEVKERFAEKIVNEVEPKRVGLLGRDIFFRINAYGLIKTLSTKFD